MLSIILNLRRCITNNYYKCCMNPNLWGLFCNKLMLRDASLSLSQLLHSPFLAHVYPCYEWHTWSLLYISCSCCLCSICFPIFSLLWWGFNVLTAFSFLHNRAKASLPGFEVLPLHQFGTWGPEITTKLDPEKDTYVMVCMLLHICCKMCPFDVLLFNLFNEEIVKWKHQLCNTYWTGLHCKKVLISN